MHNDILDIAKENEENSETTKGKGLLLRFAARAVDQPKQALGTPEPAARGNSSKVGRNEGACCKTH